MNLCIAILGPTACGKSAFAHALAKEIKGELLSLDATAIYRGFDIGSAKPDRSLREELPYHLIDSLDPQESFSAYDFVLKANDVIHAIQKRDRLPIIVGGSYFYLKALQHGLYPVPAVAPQIVDSVEAEFFDGEGLDTGKMHETLAKLDLESSKTIHPNDRYRLIRALAILRAGQPAPSSLKAQPLTTEQAQRRWMKYALAIPRHALNRAIVDRTRTMIQAGLVEETKQLRQKHPAARALQSIGYLEACKFLDGKLDQKRLEEEIIEKTRQLAKRQLTWIRSDPEIRFIDTRDTARVLKEINNLRDVLKG